MLLYLLYLQGETQVGGVGKVELIQKLCKAQAQNQEKNRETLLGGTQPGPKQAQHKLKLKMFDNDQ